MSESADTAAFVHALRFDAGHPSFAGHFPGRPIVAGVLLLEAAAQALHAWRGLSVRQVVDAKFLAPLLPDEDAELTLMAVDERRFRFTVRRGDATLLRGTLEASA
ncbi:MULTISPECIES: hydroxymyristoyl-ACP dehydratase [Luteibacter]|uniref:Hydroxymyristoyl-ACP dehydratase n=1 Tax=Luteibacter flocculans TaxID=2780091 RepID=A0ABY4T077_9GAMM|nr:MULTISPECIES: hydroxymyristoyl-ACP dehydratase [Luteibacter]URL58349.1 hydroxymyristoyl-ACP dehydratase [Luteibacter flocculans]SFW71539.1 FabA-like domain-containing protein [Luteibacter sp. UNCMF366Tsu5.1]